MKGTSDAEMKPFLAVLWVQVISLTALAGTPTPAKPLELVLIAPDVVFCEAATNSMEILARNVGEKTIVPNELLLRLSILWDAKEYGRNPNRPASLVYDGPPLGPKGSMRIGISVDEFLMPQHALTPGWHTLAVRAEVAESNKVSVFVPAFLAKDFHLVQTQLLDNEASGVPGDVSTVYVLVPPDDSRPFVFKTFDSKAMNAAISSLRRGSVVHYDANGFLPRVPEAQMEALRTSCRKKGVDFIKSNVN